VPDPPRDRTDPSNLTLLRGHLLYKALAEAGFADPRLAKVKADLIADILEDVPLFAGLDTADRRAVASAAQIAGVSGGQIIVREGTSSEALYVLLTGSATEHRSDGELTRLTRGDFLGELGQLEGAQRTARVTADRELWILKISRKAFADLVQQEPRLGELVRRRLAERSEPPKST
jgi:CRP-like cAMP-binding protein